MSHNEVRDDLAEKKIKKQKTPKQTTRKPQTIPKNPSQQTTTPTIKTEVNFNL